MTTRTHLAPTLQPQSTPVAVLQRACACGQHTEGDECAACRHQREGMLQRAALSATPVGTLAPPIVHEVLRAPGRPLDAATRAVMEPRFGRDFSDVRVHEDEQAAASAQAVSARAYTVGKHIAFGEGWYQPQSGEGKALLAHELVHTVQQAGTVPTSAARIGSPGDASEREAETYARQINTAAAPGEVRAPASGSLIQRQALSKDEILKLVAKNEEEINAPVSRSQEEIDQLQRERNRLVAELARAQHPATMMPPKAKTTETKAPEPVSIPVGVTYTVVGAFDLPSSAGGASGNLAGQVGASLPDMAPDQLGPYAPALPAAAGQATLRFVNPLRGNQALGAPNTYTRFIGPVTQEGGAAFFDPQRLTMNSDMRPRLYQGASIESTLAADKVWRGVGVDPSTELNEVSRLLRTKGFQALTAEERALVQRVTLAHTQRAPAYVKSPLLSMTELMPEEALQKLPPTATNRAYVVRVQIDPADVGHVNDILKGSKEAARLSGEVEVVVAKNLAQESGRPGSGVKILSIRANPSGLLGGVGGALLKWGGRAAVVIGAGLAVKDVLTAEGPHRRETQGKAFGAFAGGTVAGAFAVGMCIGLGVATGGLAILGCGLVAGVLGGLGGGWLGGKAGSLFD